MNSIKSLLRVALPLGLFALSGCSGIGPATVAPSRFDYTAAIGDSWKQQMLINLVKMRYGDAPVFLDVASVISQYQIAGQIDIGTTINNNPWSTSQTLGATGLYVDRPTITFTPIIGDKFARSMMSPVPPSCFPWARISPVSRFLIRTKAPPTPEPITLAFFDITRTMTLVGIFSAEKDGWTKISDPFVNNNKLNKKMMKLSIYYLIALSFEL